MTRSRTAATCRIFLNLSARAISKESGAGMHWNFLGLTSGRAPGGFIARTFCHSAATSILDMVSELKGRRQRFRRLRQAITGARLDQAELFDIARNRRLGHMDAPARQLAAKVVLGFDLLTAQEVHNLRSSIDLVHAILCRQLINIP